MSFKHSQSLVTEIPNLHSDISDLSIQARRHSITSSHGYRRLQLWSDAKVCSSCIDKSSILSGDNESFWIGEPPSFLGPRCLEEDLVCRAVGGGEMTCFSSASSPARTPLGVRDFLVGGFMAWTRQTWIEFEWTTSTMLMESFPTTGPDHSWKVFHHGWAFSSKYNKVYQILPSK